MMIKAGDVVQLKSGGPKMTVDWVDPETNTTLCTWFEGAKRNEAPFSTTSLVLAKD
jgi:uncharacterized protein YodC (DUF2158 family)